MTILRSKDRTECADTVYTQYKERTYNIEISQIMTNTYHVYIDSALYDHATVHGERETYMYSKYNSIGMKLE